MQIMKDLKSELTLFLNHLFHVKLRCEALL
jgi:hypothetical protein